jgi:hypothetical protein
MAKDKRDAAEATELRSRAEELLREYGGIASFPDRGRIAEAPP